MQAPKIMIEILILCSLLCLGSAWNQPSTCYVRQSSLPSQQSPSSCSSSSEIQELRNDNQELRNDIQELRSYLAASLEGMTSTLEQIGIVTCPSLSAPSNGEVSVSSGTHGVMSVGAVATFSCNTDYGLIGSARRTCEPRVSGLSVLGVWSGSQPLCQEFLTCPSLLPLINGNIMLTPSDDINNILGLGSVVTYSCNLGYVLVGVATRECQMLPGGASEDWSGAPPVCDEAVYCPELTAPGNGSVTISSEFNPLSVGTVASYSCDPGHALLGLATRTCVDPDQDSVGTWTGDNVECPQILCPELAAPQNGAVITSSANLVVGVIATFSCDPDLVLVGEVTRTCEEHNGDTVGMWSGTDTTCAVPNLAMIDCGITDCRSTQLVCPEEDNCTVDCHDSQEYACYQTDVFCPSRSGNCTVNCDDSYACLQANTTCPQGDCAVNCLNPFTCSNSLLRCAGDNCLLNCDGENSCTEVVIDGISGNYTMNCNSDETCHDSSVVCPPNGICDFNCVSLSACHRSSVACPTSGECSVNCNAQAACREVDVTCPEEGDCDIFCNGFTACQHTDFSCPSHGNCDVDCRGYRTCELTQLTCPVKGDCDVFCNDYRACQNAELNCSIDGYCRMHCEYYDACLGAQFLCPSGARCDFIFVSSLGFTDYTGGSSIVNCEEGSSCSVFCQTTVVSDRIWNCRDSRVNCPKDSGNCSVECSGLYSCRGSNIDCGVSGDCLSCSGPNSCLQSIITYSGSDPAVLECNGTASCQSSTITCPQNDCAVHCSNDDACRHTRITCPNDSPCATYCTGDTACRDTQITCPSNSPCVTSCTEANACISATITCPTDESCTINCDGANSCNGATVTCPTGDHSCNILCTDPLSCLNLVVTNTHRLNLQCCGDLSCVGAGATPTSFACPYIQ